MTGTAGTRSADVGQALADLLCLPVDGQPRESRRGYLSDRVVKGAAALVDDSGVMDLWERWRDEDDPDRSSKGGAPTLASERVALILLIVLVVTGDAPLVTRITEAYTSRLHSPMRDLLGLPRVETASDAAVYHRLRRALKRLLAVIDPFPDDGGRRRTRAEVEALLDSYMVTLKDGTTDYAPEVKTKITRLLTLTNALLEASFQLLPADVRHRWQGNVCVDATLVQVFGKAGSPTEKDGRDCSGDRMSPEFRAGWYVRHEDRRDIKTTTGRRKRRDKFIWGYEAHLVVMGANTPDTDPDFPLLVLGMSLEKPGSRVGDNAATILACVAGHGHPTGYCAADRAYFPDARPETFQLPARALGYRLIGDYRDDQLGVQAEYGGAPLIEGNHYCPAIPQPLIDATIDLRAGRITAETHAERIAQRSRYLFRPKHAPTPDGNTAHMCPARGPGATAICAHAPKSGPVSLDTPSVPPRRPRSTAPKKAKTRILNPPEHPDFCCTNTTSITFPTAPDPNVTPRPTYLAKYLQDMQYGTPEHHAMYATLRNTIEGYNGFTKDPNNENLEEAGRRRVRGYAFQALLIACLILASNIRKIETFLKKRNDDTTEQTGSAAGRHGSSRRKRRADLADYLPDPNAPPLSRPA